MNPRSSAFTNTLSKRFQSSASIVALAACLVLPSVFHSPDAPAVTKESLHFPHAMTPLFRWSEPIDMSVAGMYVTVRQFVADSTLEKVAQTMARHQDYFQRVTTLPGSILLSGVLNGQHWVAQLEAKAGRVVGMVSVLPLAAPEAAASGKGNEPPWLAQHASLIFQQASGHADKKSMQSIHMPHHSVAQFMDALNSRLLQSGWRRSGPHSWVESSSGGEKRGGRFDVFPVQTPGGDAVFVSRVL